MAGEVIFQGTPRELMESETSVTGAYLTGARSIAVPKSRRPELKGEARGSRRPCEQPQGHRRQNPLGVFTTVTGVSGSGKSSLVNDILYKSLAKTLYRAGDDPGAHDRIDGIELIDKVHRNRSVADWTDAEIESGDVHGSVHVQSAICSR